MKKIKFCTFICGATGIFTYYLIKWLGKNFGSNLNIEQLLWTAMNSPGQADVSFLLSFAVLLLKVGLLYCLLYFVVFRLDGLTKVLYFIITHPVQTLRLLKLVIKSWASKFKYSYLVILLFLISVAFCGIQLSRLDRRYGLYSFIVSQLKMSSNDFIGDNYFVPDKKEISFPFKRDLVIVLAESFETSFFDKNISKEFIPEGRMMRTRSDGLFTNNMQQIRGTGWTIASMTAWHFGLPLKLPSFVEGNNYFSKRGFFPGAKSIFDVLRDNGYETVFVLGSDSNFSNKRTLFTEHGNFKIMDRQYWQQLGWELEKYKGTGWGYNDKFVFERALGEYKRLKKQGRPFVLFVETVDTHAPEGWSPRENVRYRDIRDALSYLDRNIDEFISNVKATDPNNTAIAVIGDHLFMGDKEYLSKDNRRIFNMFWTPNIKAMKSNQERPISALDIAPTLLELTGCRWSNQHYGLGESFFSDKKNLLEKYSLIELDNKLSEPSRLVSDLY